jgi:hypothetical protein
MLLSILLNYHNLPSQTLIYCTVHYSKKLIKTFLRTCTDLNCLIFFQKRNLSSLFKGRPQMLMLHTIYLEVNPHPLSRNG